jgi:uncharacterized membrane protein (DUF485 family)
MSDDKNTKNEYAGNAISAAKSVDFYGFGIQVISIAAAVLIFVAYAYGWLEITGSLGAITFGAIVALPVGIFGYISGALYRMIANYILYKTTD